MTEKNVDLNLHNSGYVASSYTTGTLSGKIVGGLIGEANGIYIVNNITTATLVASSAGSTLGGFVGRIQFKNLLNSFDTFSISPIVLPYSSLLAEIPSASPISASRNKSALPP